jgi:hypothetical protein
MIQILFLFRWEEQRVRDVIKDEENEYFKMARVQWWVPMKKKSNLDEQHLYEDCWSGKWKCNLADLEQWLDISTILFSFLAQKMQQTKVKLIFLILMLVELKLISMLLMLQPICEGCW